MISTGTTLQQRYKIEKQIGQGGMGAVYIATDERFNSTVAIKETLAMDDNFRKAIEREARLLNSLKHPVLPRVSDHFEEENSQFLVMEYIPGEDLCCVLEHRGTTAFDVSEVLKWADDLLDALDYLHNQANPVVHRDIKPQNLKLTPRGEVILLDFGLAKGNPTDAGNQTAAKSIFGYSRSYASLEQIQGTGTDPRSDLYSLAATLYYLLTNREPEDALTRAMAVLSQKPDPLVPANVLNSAVPRGVAGVLHMAMSLNADERPSSAANMRQMLRENEKFGYLADPATVAGNVGQTGVFGHNTRLMMGGTEAEPGRNTDAKTELLPGYISQPTAVHAENGREAVTHVASSGTTAAPPRRKSFFAVALAGTAAILLGVGAVTGGIYLLSPAAATSDVQSAPQPIAVPAANAETAPASNTAGPADAGVTTATANVASTGSTTAETRKDQSISTTKQTDPSKTGKDTQVDAGVDPDLSDMDIPDVKIGKGKGGDMVITQRDSSGKVITTRVPMPKQPNGQPAPGFDPFPGGFDFRNMSPQQREQLKQMIRRSQQMQQRQPQRDQQQPPQPPIRIRPAPTSSPEN